MLFRSLVEAMARVAREPAATPQERAKRLELRPQPLAGITYARLLQKQDYAIDWTAPALAVHRRVMGLYPGAYCQRQGLRLKVLDSEPLVARLRDQLSPEGQRLADRWGGSQPQTPGSILAVEEGVGAVIATGGCPLLMREGQLEGRRAARGSALLQQLNLRVGDNLTD